MLRKLLPLLALGVTLTLVLAGCGSSGKATSTTGTSTTGAAGAGTTTTISAKQLAAQQAATSANVKARSKNELILDGFSEGSLSQLAYQDYQKQGGTETVSIENDGAGTAFENLCRGEVDIVDSASAISKSELKQCEDDGVTPVEIQVGSDAVVLATENETDVGADCLTLAQVKSIFKAGSPVENWDQLGFDDVPLSVAGPEPGNTNFTFFGSALVGAGSPTLADFRFDYHAFATENQIRGYVVGTEEEGELASQRLPAAIDEIANLNALIVGWNDTVRGARAYVKSATQQDNATALAAATAKLDNALSALATLKAELASEERLITRYRGIEKTAEEVLGRLGVFQYGYYTLFEEQLRPLEITAKASPENCIFPSQATITNGSYPLSRQLLLTVSLQELRQNEGLRDFLLSYLKNANTLTTANVLVPLPNNILVQEENWLNGTTTPTTVTSTSTTAASGSQNSMSGAGTTTSTTASGNTGSASSGSSSNTTSGNTGSVVPQGVH